MYEVELKKLSVGNSPNCKRLRYSTAGFRCPSNDLLGVSSRNGQFVGVMVTASHNPAQDNGLKLVDPNGGMLDSSWESIVEEFAHCSISDAAKWIRERDSAEKKDICPNVVIGYDTRISSPTIAEELQKGMTLMRSVIISLGLVTTPQLHFAVQYLNGFDKHHQDQSVHPKMEAIYTSHFLDRFVNSYAVVAPQANSPIATVEVNVDCAHGIGAIVLLDWQKKLADRKRTVTGRSLQLNLYNTEVKMMDLLNKECGADYVKISMLPPTLTPMVSSSPTVGERWASIDGDADRLIYYYVTQCQPLGQQHLVLLDGDRIACLFTSFIQKQLQSLIPPDDAGQSRLSVGVVQTAYTNAGSTHYLMDVLKVPVVCVPTGVKHLHKAAHQFDFGVYFEANGHGTVVYSPAARDHLERHFAPDHPLRTFFSLTNTAIGDALTDLLLVEYCLAWYNWSLDDWANLYTDLPSRQIKLAVADPTLIQTEDAERRVACPIDLQHAIDRTITTVDRATGQPGLSRAFVRPSGTERVVRVYAESVSRSFTDWLATEVAILTHQLASGTGPAPQHSGPMPTV